MNSPESMGGNSRAIEAWRPAPGHDGLYEVSSLGRVRSLYFDPPRLLVCGTDSCGYPTIMFTKDGKRRPFTVHRLVCRAFHGEPKNVLDEVAHCDGDKTNCSAANLRWATKVANEADKRRHGTRPEGEMMANAKLTKQQAQEIFRRCSAGENQPSLAKEFGVHTSIVWRIVHRRSWASATEHLPNFPGAHQALAALIIGPVIFLFIALFHGAVA